MACGHERGCTPTSWPPWKPTLPAPCSRCSRPPLTDTGHVGACPIPACVAFQPMPVGWPCLHLQPNHSQTHLKQKQVNICCVVIVKQTSSNTHAHRCACTGLMSSVPHSWSPDNNRPPPAVGIIPVHHPAGCVGTLGGGQVMADVATRMSGCMPQLKAALVTYQVTQGRTGLWSHVASMSQMCTARQHTGSPLTTSWTTTTAKPPLL